MQAKNIRKTYDHTHYVLTDFSYTFERGKIYVIKGVSGCGKTTLVNILGGIDRDYEGEVVCENDSFAFVTQDNLLFAKWTVFENLAFVKNDREQIEHLSRTLGVENLLDKYPSRISGGERQRVCIIRALLTNPTVLLADEPAASLDAKNAGAVADAFDLLRSQNRTILIVSHKSCFDHIADEIIQLDYGKIKAVSCSHREQAILQPEAANGTDHVKTDYKFIFFSLLKKNREQFKLKKYGAMALVLFLFLACLSARLNFENEYANLLTKKYPADVFYASSSEAEMLKDTFSATIYENYTIQGDGFRVLGLLPGADSGFYYNDMVLAGDFPDRDDALLVDHLFVREILHLTQDAEAVGRTISIQGRDFSIAGVVPALDFDGSNEYIACNVYYQFTNEEYESGVVQPRVYMPYQTISKIGTLVEDSFVMVKIENLYAGRTGLYREVREALDMQIFPWDSKVSNIQSALDVVFIALMGFTVVVGFIAFLFQQNEVRLEYFYRRREIGGLRLIGVRRKVIFLFLLLERLIKCCCALLLSSLSFAVISAIVYLALKIWLFVPLYWLIAIAAVVLLYNTLLVYASSKKLLRVDLLQLL